DGPPSRSATVRGAPRIRSALSESASPARRSGSSFASATKPTAFSGQTTSAGERSAAVRSPALVAWPENAVGFVAEANELPLRRAGEALSESALLILGAPRTVADRDGGP